VPDRARPSRDHRCRVLSADPALLEQSAPQRTTSSRRPNLPPSRSGRRPAGGCPCRQNRSVAAVLTKRAKSSTPRTGTAPPSESRRSWTGRVATRRRSAAATCRRSSPIRCEASESEIPPEAPAAAGTASLVAVAEAVPAGRRASSALADHATARFDRSRRSQRAGRGHQNDNTRASDLAVAEASWTSSSLTSTNASTPGSPTSATYSRL
jgi:hypothetical protein